MKKLALSLSTAVLLWLSFPPLGYTWLVFVAFVPLLILDDNAAAHHPQKSLTTASKFAASGATQRYIYLSFVVFVVLTTWWVKNAAWIGLLGGTIMNTLIMYCAWAAHQAIKNKLGAKLGYLALPFVWVATEYIHLNHWDFDFPWLPLGNAFAAHHTWVQWYEYTGVLGGTLWIWAANLMAFWAYKTHQKSKINPVFVQKIAITILIIGLPLGVSLMLYNAEKTTKTKNKFAEIVIVQPNIDPYNDKFNGALAPRQLNDFLALAQAKITPNTQLILLPETSIPGTIYINEKNWQLDTLNGFLKKYPNITIVAGALALQTYAATDTIPYTARSSGDGYYDVYNAAIAVQYNQPIEIYKKSKLVIGVEKMPYSKQISFLKKLIVDLGGTTGQLGIQDHRTAFAHKNISIAPIICYESIFGNYVADYVRQADANVFAIITNDGWWGDTPGHKQHFDYARLRAIECRRSIARSANTGISGYIDAQGDATQLLTWWQQGARVQRVALHTQRTFYVQYGDIIGIGATAVSVIFVLLMAFKKK